MKPRSSIILGVCTVTLLVVLAYKEFIQTPAPEIAFVNNFELFEGFTYKKELTRKFEKVEQARKSQLDSLRYALSEYKVYLDQIDKPDLEKFELFNVKKNNYLSIEQRFLEDAEAQTQEYDQLIFERLNEYVEDYSKENEIDLLIGVSESGTVMYGENKFDITDELIEYINSKYAG